MAGTEKMQILNSRLSTLIGAFILVAFAIVPNALAHDPYKAISRHVLDNGMTVYLAPSSAASTVSIKIQVKAGWSGEHDENLGVAHLLEHALFRDPELSEDLSYLQVIREAGGEVNGTTDRFRTEYFASIPAQKADWLVETMAKVIQKKKLPQATVDKAKNEVMLEIGQPQNYLQKALEWVRRIPFREPSVWELELGWPNDPPLMEETRRKTRELKVEHIDAFYKQYYRPQNMKVFYAGRIDTEKSLALIRKHFSSLPPTPGLSVEYPQATAPRRPYEATTLTHRSPTIYLGTLAYRIDAVDEFVLRSYFSYLSHVLMKEIRNRNAETYTANGSFYIDTDYGLAGLYLDVPEGRFDHYVQTLKGRIHAEAIEGKLSDKAIQEALELYRKNFDLIEGDANSMAHVASFADKMIEIYNETNTPSEILNQLTPADFRARLKILMAPQRAYTYLEAPPSLFRGDAYLFICGIPLLVFWGFRFLLRKRFAHAKVRYVRKIKYSIFTLAKYLVVCLALMLVPVFLNYVFFYLKYYFQLRSSLWINAYGTYSLTSFAYAALALGFLSSLPRKIIVVGDELVLKSLSYGSRRWALSEVESVEILAPRDAWKRFSRETRLVHWGLFRKGLWLRLKTGRAYYLALDDLVAVKAELEMFLQPASAKDDVRFKISG